MPLQPLRVANAAAALERARAEIRMKASHQQTATVFATALLESDDEFSGELVTQADRIS